MPDRKTAPLIHDAIEFDYTLPPIRPDRFENGLPLYWLNAGVQDVLEIDFVFPAGIWNEQKPAVAYAVAGLLKNGTSRRSAHEISEALEFYGAALKVQTGNDFTTITLHTLTKHLQELLPVVLEVITDAVFPEEELEIYRQNAIQRLLVSLRQCEFVANQRIDALLFGQAHPYGRFSKRETIEALTREDLLKFYCEHLSLAGMKIFMAGRVGAKEVELLREIFGRLPVRPQTVEMQVFSPPPPSERTAHIINDPDGVQGAIRIGRKFPGRDHEDFAPMVVLNTLFGGYFGSRLMSNIREEKGYTYGIYSSLSPYQHGGSLIIHTEVGRDVVAAAIKEIYFEMERLCEAAAPEEELLLVKNYLLGNLLGDLDGPFSILRRWKTLILNGFTEEHFNRNIQVYKTIGPASLQALARKYFDVSRFYEVAVI